jgi:hypothetical protein
MASTGCFCGMRRTRRGSNACGAGWAPAVGSVRSAASSRGFVNSRTVGAVQQHFNVGAARELPVPDLPLEEQRRIADALGALDDLIDTNLELRTHLEAARRAIVASATRRSSIRIRLDDVAEHLPGKYLKKSDYEAGEVCRLRVRAGAQ